MHRMIERIAIAFGLLAMFAGTASAAGRIPVYVSVVPQRYFVQQIGKEMVDVQVMVQPGASPATYEPKPRQMAALSTARIYFAVGVPFESAWLEKIAAANPEMKVVHTDHGIEKRTMTAHHHHDDDDDAEGEEHHEAEHHHEGEHDHRKAGHHDAAEQESGHHADAGLDPHIWLSPPLVKMQARTILAALQEADPANREAYETNHREFIARIDGLDADLRQIFTGGKGMRFMVFHPAWGYFADAYGLEQVPIEIEGKSPKPAQLKELIRHARESGIRVIFVQPQFSTKSAEMVAREIGGQVAFADPLAADWMANLRDVADRFRAALK